MKLGSNDKNELWKKICINFTKANDQNVILDLPTEPPLSLGFIQDPPLKPVGLFCHYKCSSKQ